MESVEAVVAAAPAAVADLLAAETAVPDLSPTVKITVSAGTDNVEIKQTAEENQQWKACSKNVLGGHISAISDGGRA